MLTCNNFFSAKTKCVSATFADFYKRMHKWQTGNGLFLIAARYLFVNIYHYYTLYLQICQTTCFCYCISKTKNDFGQNPEGSIIFNA